MNHIETRNYFAKLVLAEDEGDQVVSHKQRCSIPNSLKAFGFILVLIAILLLLKEILLQLRTDSTYLKNWTTWVAPDKQFQELVVTFLEILAS